MQQLHSCACIKSLHVTLCTMSPCLGAKLMYSQVHTTPKQFNGCKVTVTIKCCSMCGKGQHCACKDEGSRGCVYRMAGREHSAMGARWCKIAGRQRIPTMTKQDSARRMTEGQWRMEGLLKKILKLCLLSLFPLFFYLLLLFCKFSCTWQVLIMLLVSIFAACTKLQVKWA